MAGALRRLVAGGTALALAGPLLAGAALAGCGGPSAAARTQSPVEAAALCAARSRHAVVTNVTADRAIEAAWARYAATGEGWVAGDSIYAYSVPGVGILDTLSDSYLHTMNVASHPEIVHNLFVVQRGGRFATVTAGTSAQPRSLLPAKKGLFYLGFGGVDQGRTFQQFYEEDRWWGPASLDWTPVKTVVATFALPSLRLESLHEVSRQHPRIRWGSSVARFGRFTYVYGTGVGGDGLGPAYVARVSGSSLDGPWSYWDGHGWSPHPRSAQSISAAVQTQFDVVGWAGMYVLVSSVPRPVFSPDARIYFGCSPTGPFQGGQRFTLSRWVGPLGAKHWGDRFDSGSVYVYDALAQPALGSGGRFVVSYDQNDVLFPGIFGNPAIYRPGYLDLTIRLGPG